MGNYSRFWRGLSSQRLLFSYCQTLWFWRRYAHLFNTPGLDGEKKPDGVVAAFLPPYSWQLDILRLTRNGPLSILPFGFDSRIMQLKAVGNILRLECDDWPRWTDLHVNDIGESEAAGFDSKWAKSPHQMGTISGDRGPAFTSHTNAVNLVLMLWRGIDVSLMIKIQ